MSAYTTLVYSTSAAKNRIVSAMPDLSNEDLSRILDIILDKNLYNTRVVPDAIAPDIKEAITT
jgi:hypothetical protein